MKQLMKPSTILKAAKKHLVMTNADASGSSNKTFHICLAVGSVKNADPTAVARITRDIHASLGNSYTYEEWLEANGPKLKDAYAARNTVKLQRSRVQWIDAMIAEYKKIGQ